MSPLVSNHLIPQMLKKAKTKIKSVLPSQCIAKSNYVSSASSSSLGFDLQWFFLTPKQSTAVQEKTPWSSMPVPLRVILSSQGFSAVHFNTMFPFLKYLSQTRFHAICFDGIIQQIIPYVAHYILS